MTFAVLKFAIFVSLYCSVFGTTERTVASKYGEGYECPVCPKNKICAGIAHRKACVYPKSIGERCGDNPFSVCDKGLECKSNICVHELVGLGMNCTPKGSMCEPGTTCVGPAGLKLCMKTIGKGKRCGHSAYAICEAGLGCIDNICVDKIPLGKSCLSKEAMCVDGAVCAGTNEKKLCVMPKSVRQRCGHDPFWVCQPGLTCEEGFCKIPRGKDCTPKGSLCVDGTKCAGSDDEKRCVTPKRVRQRCGQDPFAVCAMGLTCEDGFCKNPKGSDCSAKDSLCVDDTVCAGTDMKRRCVMPVDVKHRCGQTPFAVCKKGLVCEEGLCKIPKGSDCTAVNSLCVDNTICAGTDTKRKCVSGAGLRMRCEQTPFSVCKEGFVCEEGFCKIPKGGNCKVDNPLCVDNTVCAGTDIRKKCVTPRDLRKRCGQNPFVVCKKGLVCEEGTCKIRKGGNCTSVENPLCVDDNVCAGTDMQKKCVTPVNVRKRCGQNPFSVCKAGLVCEEGFCKIPKGGDCSIENPLCVDDTVCIGTNKVKKCVKPTDVGNRCGKSAFSVCKEGLVCEEGVCKIAKNGDCTAKGSLCVDNTTCIGTDKKKKCVMANGIKEPCGKDSLSICQTGLQCIGGFCRKPRIPIGGSCLKPGSICTHGTVCVGNSRMKRCVKPMSIGQQCGRHLLSVCKSGLHCIHGICKKLVHHGGDCGRKGTVCTRGTVCGGTAAMRRCVKPRPVGYRCGSNPFWVCMRGLSCRRGFCTPPKPVGLTGCGKKCKSSSGCDRGLTCELGLCKIPIGGQCSSKGSICVSKGACVGDGSRKRCVTLKGRGQRCGTTPFSMCRHGLKCEQGICKVAVGGSCTPSRSVCVSGSTCVGHRYRKRCVVLREAGARCGYHSWVCKKGLRCVHGRCRKRIVGLGGDCGSSTCACGRGLMCVWKHGRKICVKSD
eukprot:TRINITY_DN1162_c0_g1_i1.p1 TRINITY_DN1162_c0_g1~~TRINITY_DN1162_c0_g1_i1.p1  ORF type:complete len:930 (-),score=56.66 TRINITY_DN1162_c0_g1_i1:720-3509(-)